jgi:histidyl-tRNA synthetase
MGYYTGQVFEVAKPGIPFSLAGGGRYDKLIGRWLGKDVPAVGFSVGFERIVDLLETDIRRDAVAVLAEADVSPADVLAAARDLRDQGQEVVEVVRRSGKFGAQLKRLEAAGFTAFTHVTLTDGQVARGDVRALSGE